MSRTNRSDPVQGRDPDSPLTGLEPSFVWDFFDQMRRIPRPSKREEKVVAWVKDWAAEQGFGVREDAAGNLVVDVPATAGHGSAPSVAIQGHLDMVCEKNRGVAHDFEVDPIRVRLEEHDGATWVAAEGTTLGADNGVGVALGMAAAVDPDVIHGPLELLMTLDEETGLHGAAAFDGSLLASRLLINLDSEEEGAVFIGCAGAAGFDARLDLRRAPRDDRSLYELTVRGLRGGHSGMEIHLDGGNAVRMMASLLLGVAEEGHDPGLVRFAGGEMHNAIPRECFATVAQGDDTAGALRAAIETRLAAWRTRHGRVDPDLRVEMRRLTSSEMEAAWADLGTHGPLEPGDALRWLRLLDALPHGVLGTSKDIPGLVETSNNLAAARLEPGTGTAECVGTIRCAARSQVDAALTATASSMASACRLAGAEAVIDPGYPGWTPNPASDLLRRTLAATRAVLGEEPEVTGVHAGLECGILVQKVPGLDAVSFGPDLRGAHSPQERVSVPSVARTYRILATLLADLASS